MKLKKILKTAAKVLGVAAAVGGVTGGLGGFLGKTLGGANGKILGKGSDISKIGKFAALLGGGRAPQQMMPEQELQQMVDPTALGDQNLMSRYRRLRGMA